VGDDEGSADGSKEGSIEGRIVGEPVEQEKTRLLNKILAGAAGPGRILMYRYCKTSGRDIFRLCPLRAAISTFKKVFTSPGLLEPYTYTKSVPVTSSTITTGIS